MEYNVALYIRLSVEDNDLAKSGKAESNSVSNQRDLLLSFIKSNSDLAQSRILEFCDDGFSGTNFQRPGITRLLEQARAGNIDCILVKDFSRFGRDYIEVSDYIDQIFPFLKVRFISVNDGYDSSKMDGITSGVDTAFRNIIYSYYSEDLSQKTRSGKLTRARKGEYIGAYAPYGYMKDSGDKRRLVVDKEAAEVVSRIFRMAISGMSAVRIARLLNDEGVPTPSMWKKKQGFRHKWPIIGESNFWTNGTVILILRDERYTGKNIYGKRSRPETGKVKTVKVPKDKWVVVADRHMPIVSEEEFAEAQDNLAKYAERKNVYDYGRPLYGKVKCGVCKHALPRLKKPAPLYYCASSRFISGAECMNTRILESEIETALLCVIRSYTQMLLDMEKPSAKKLSASENAKQLQNQIKELEFSIKKLSSLKLKYYEENADGKRSKESYLLKQAELNRKEEGLRGEIAELRDELRQLQAKLDKSNSTGKALKDCPSITALTKEVVNTLVDAVYVHSDCSIEIKLKFISECERAGGLI